MKPPYTRQELPKLSREVLGRYHDLLMTNDVGAYERLLEQYDPHIDKETRLELIEQFKLYAEALVRRRWLGPKWR
jgi:succinate dehydrogenase flavin-adding protein (antitoxin of CptAB toxin-antitoxin module)